ncbi:hypothetical protein F5883DRAFT_668312 [Diaporthe sp. PMI_573]|nr:hypothetical protein F5883DRAFT_668312 [Diaporthaceae sp. PMI_573]
MVILAGVNSESERDSNNKAATIASIVFLFIFNLFFVVGWLRITWLYPAKIVPLCIRAPTNTLLTLGNWIVNFMTVYCSLKEMDSNFHKVLGWKGVFSVVHQAKVEPKRYGKNGELLIDYSNTKEGRAYGHGQHRRSDEEKGVTTSHGDNGSSSHGGAGVLVQHDEEKQA